MVLVCYEVLSVLSSFAFISLERCELVALLYLFACCNVAFSVLCLLLMGPWVGLHFSYIKCNVKVILMSNDK